MNTPRTLSFGEVMSRGIFAVYNSRTETLSKFYTRQALAPGEVTMRISSQFQFLHLPQRLANMGHRVAALVHDGRTTTL